MSDALRTYGGGENLSGRARGPGARMVWRVLGAAILVVAITALWWSRDTHNIDAFVPADQQVYLVVTDLVSKRFALADSQVLRTVPPGWPGEGIPSLLRNNFGRPDWVIRNVIGPRLFVAGNDLAEGRDLLYVTRMTRVGTMTARFYRTFRGIERDRAGGLELRYLPEHGLYYATRGRILLVSPSRRMLIGALSLEVEERARPEEIDAVLAGAGSEDIRGVVSFSADEPGGGYLSALRFALRVGSDEAQAKFRIRLAEELESELSDVLQEAKPTRLARPVAGPIAMSLDLATPSRSLWTKLGAIVDWPFFSEKQWSEWREPNDDSAGATLTEILGNCGPGLRLTWLGLDTNEMTPFPKLVGSVDGGAAEFGLALERLEGPAHESRLRGAKAYVLSEPERIVAPSIGGPNLQVSLSRRGDSLFVATNPELAKRYLAEGPAARGSLEEKGNLFVAIEPTAVARAVIEAGASLAEYGLLEGHTRESYQLTAREWMERALIAQRVTLTASVVNGSVEGDVSLICAPAAESP